MNRREPGPRIGESRQHKASNEVSFKIPGTLEAGRVSGKAVSNHETLRLLIISYVVKKMDPKTSS